MSKNKIKKLAHQRVNQLPKRALHEVVVEGCVGVGGRPNYRLVVQVTLTADVNGIGRLQSTGIAYTNPTPYDGAPNGDAYDYKLGYKIARGNAELSMGLQILLLDDAANGPSSASMLDKQLVNAVHSVPYEIKKWR